MGELFHKFKVGVESPDVATCVYCGDVTLLVNASKWERLECPARGNNKVRWTL